MSTLNKPSPARRSLHRLVSLCFVKGCWAYFTPKKLSEEWGDDWNDAPYEHNAGEPYGEGVVKVAFDADLEQPRDRFLNSPFSVEQINAGEVAWLRSPSWKSGAPVVIHAGTSIEEFFELVRKSGGEVYVKANNELRDASPKAETTNKTEKTNNV